MQRGRGMILCLVLFSVPAEPLGQWREPKAQALSKPLACDRRGYFGGAIRREGWGGVLSVLVFVG